MSSEPAPLAIKISGLSKHYVLGRPRTGRSLRQVAEDLLFLPLRVLRGQWQSEPPPSLWALQDINLELPAGSVLGIVGRNGSGKSTLLKIISRLTRPTTGFVEVTGRVTSLLEVGVGFHYELTGRENIYLSGAILGLTRNEIDERFEAIVAFAEIDRFIDTPVKHYSSGMYMRLAFAVAVHLEPDILVLDEVLAVGDISFQRRCLQRLQEIRERRTTILFVSHSMEPVLDLCSEALCLHEGRIIARGDPRSVVQSYLELNPEARVQVHRRIDSLPENRFQKARSADSKLALTGLELEGAESMVDGGIPHASGFALLASIHLRATGEDLRCLLRLYDESERLVLECAETLVPRSEDLQVQISWPGGWLEPGRYQVELELAQATVIITERCLRLHIINNDFAGLGQRVMRPRLDWALLPVSPGVEASEKDSP